MKKILLALLLLVLTTVNAYTIPPMPGGSVTGATINDSAGDGDSTETWSADKIYDQLALKLGTSDKAADSDKLDNHDSTYFQIDMGITGITDTTNTTSSTIVASATAVKAAKDAADAKVPFTSGLRAALPGSCTQPSRYVETDQDKLEYECNSSGTFSPRVALPAATNVPLALDASGNPIAGTSTQFGGITGFKATPDTAGNVGYNGGWKWYDTALREAVAVDKEQTLTNKTLTSAKGIKDRLVAGFNGGGTTVIAANEKTVLTVPYNCTITGGQILASKKLGTSGAVSIVVNIWREATATNYDGGSSHPAVGDKITASAPPTISSGNRAAIDPATWGAGATLSQGDILVFNVDSVTDAVVASVTLYIESR